MSLFSTRNHDGASGRGEPADTVPRNVVRGMDRCAEHEGADNRADLFSAPTVRGKGGGRDGFNPRNAGRN